MLVELSIRDFILIDRLDLSFTDGLTVLSGETGAGKSILLDALSLAIGGRGETGLIRQKKDQAVVTASFEIKNHNTLKSYLKEIEVDFQEIEEDGLILRRVIKREGSSRAFLNDRPISVNALKGIGELLVEIQGQFDAHGLMRTSGHRQFLDLFANHSALLNAVGEKFLYWENCKNRFETAKLELKQSIEEQELLEFSLNELVVLSIKDGEEEELAELRNSLTDAEKNINIHENHYGLGMFHQYGPHFGWGAFRPYNIYSNTSGILYVDIIEYNSKKLVWQGKAIGFIREGSAEEKIEKISQFISKIFEQYPPQND